MKKVAIILAVVIFVLLVILLFVPVPKRPIISQLPTGEDAKIFSPQAKDTISSPIIVKGQAKGSWFFEGSFPVKIVDQDGTVLGASPATAIGAWMTTGTVPFEAVVGFAQPDSANGTIILAKDNPSGLPENENFVIVPISFAATSSDSQVVKVFFGSKYAEQGSECDVMYPAYRMIPKTQAPARAALEELLSGPTAEEDNLGYLTSINPGVKIQSLTIANGTAKVDFNQALQQSVAGSCRVTAIRNEIENTLKQFSAVQNVVISINGKTEGVLQP
ncbi:MAG: GerMN domain-containing protein [Patescibacteria group bacterium]|nr:GerMN domain-containing protein [Patescibacteria group bacterium]MDE2015778.1 GerMN domain-containing protein [Patescibacteria group bacterium]MDE2226835.1 GerMN domain-containing protein [Patescibacteria group bacterium]